MVSKAKKWTLIGCGAAFGLFLLLVACTAVLFALVDDTAPEEAQKKEEKVAESDPIADFKNAFKQYKIALKAMDKVETAKNEEDAKKIVSGALLLVEDEMRKIKDFERREDLKLFEYRVSLATNLEIYAALINSVLKAMDEGLPAKKAIDELYKKKVGEIIAEMEKLEKQLPEIEAALKSGKEPAKETTSKPAENKLVTKEKYDKLKTGMSYEEVVKIIGWEGEEMSQNEVGGTKTVMYMWQNPDGSNMNAMFQNDKLIQKSQFGLK